MAADSRMPADPAWRKGGLYHDDAGWGVPALWFNSWYDVSIGPNMALFNHARTVNSDKEASANQYVVVTPSNHCGFNPRVLTGPYKSGDRALGSINFDAEKEVYAFFDRWLKGDTAAFPATTPAVRYYSMGANAWRDSAQWPPKDAAPVRMYFRSSGRANSVNGDGKLTMERRFQLVRASDGATVLRGRWELVCIDISGGRPRRMPPEFLAAYMPQVVAAA